MKLNINSRLRWINELCCVVIETVRSASSSGEASGVNNEVFSSFTSSGKCDLLSK